jgi:hypothetical protein
MGNIFSINITEIKNLNYHYHYLYPINDYTECVSYFLHGYDKNKENEIKRFIESYDALDKPNKFGHKIINYVIWHCSDDLIIFTLNKYIERKYNITGVDKLGMNIFHHVCKHCSHNIIKFCFNKFLMLFLLHDSLDKKSKKPIDYIKFNEKCTLTDKLLIIEYIKQN